MKKHSVRIIGVPLDLGASRRGVDMGPSALRVANLGGQLKELGHEVLDIGNIPVPVAESHDPGNEKAKYLSEILEVSKSLAEATYSSMQAGQTPLVLGGDHSIGMGSISGISKYLAESKKKLGLIWLDAHGDLNTPEISPSGNIHGMPLAHLVGLGRSELNSLAGHTPAVDPSKVVLIGVRDLDVGEKKIIQDLGIKTFTMRDIDEKSLRSIMHEAIQIASDGTAGFHVSFDVDWLDPQVAPGVGTPVPGGGTYREGHLAMECIADSGKMISLEVAEVNPLLDFSSKTAHSAVAMVLSAFGKRIL